jgi:hypothetical protein
MKYNNLPVKWKAKLTEYIRQEFGEDREELLAGDFRYHLSLNLADGSFAFFHHAFYILDREASEVTIFTEHCGYHIFPLYGTSLNLFESKWSDIGMD